MKDYNEIKENWQALKLELKKKYPQLTDGDLELVAGYENETFKNLQAKTGKDEDAFFTELKSFTAENNTYKPS